MAEEKLKAMARVTAGTKSQPEAPVEASLNRQKGRTTPPAAGGDQEKLFNQFLEWSKKQGK